MLRGELLLDKHDLAAARADLAAAWKAEDDPDLGLEIATLYQDKDQFEDAVASFDQWLATHPDNVHEIYALNGRCWARALWDHELDKALADCDRAVTLAPFSTDLRDSRALVWLRMNQLPRAIGDYNFALRGQSKSAWSLYGRGVAETRRGDTARGQADIAEAEKLDPKTLERARRLAILP